MNLNDLLSEELEDLPSRESMNRKHGLKVSAGKKGSKNKESIGLSVRQLLTATEEQLQRIYADYKALDDNYEIPSETRTAKLDTYEHIFKNAVKSSFDSPYTFYVLSKNLVRQGIVSLGHPITEEKSEFKKLRKTKGYHGTPHKVFEREYMANQNGIYELNKFLSRIPVEDNVELAFIWNPDSGLNPVLIKQSSKKSRIVSIDDIDYKNLTGISVKVHSPERGDYGFAVDGRGYIKAEIAAKKLGVE
jgi:hypothetical protein